MDLYRVTFKKPKELQEGFLNSISREIYVEAAGIIPAIDKAIEKHTRNFSSNSLGYIITAVKLIEKEGEF